jgi:hypothetical protein
MGISKNVLFRNVGGGTLLENACIILYTAALRVTLAGQRKSGAGEKCTIFKDADE